MPPAPPDSPDGAATRRVDLGEFGPGRLWFALLRNRFTGTVTLPQADPAGPRRVWVRGGMPVFTDWVSAGDVLGTVLVETGAVGPSELGLALAELALGGTRLGELLVRRGSVTQDAMLEALRLQCQRKLLHTFAATRGEAAITSDGRVTEYEPELLQVNVLELLRLGGVAHFDRARALAELAELATQAVAPAPAFERYRSHFRFDSTDDAILAALTRGASLEQLEQRWPTRAAALLHTLWCCSMLAPATTSPAVSPLAAAPRLVPAPGSPLPAASAAPAPAPPSPPPAVSLTPTGAASAGGRDEATFLAQLEGYERRIAAREHAFALLGVPLDAGKPEVRAAFTDLGRLFHPDSLQARGFQHLHERVEKVFAALSEAQMLLGDKDKREQLRRRIETGQPADEGDASHVARAALEAELLAREADKFLAAGKFEIALERFREALARHPDEPDVAAAAIWCEFLLGAKDGPAVQRGISALDAILQENPRVARAHYFRGMILLRTGNEGVALGAFETAHSIDRRLVDAERQARAIKLKRAPPKPPKEEKSLLGRLLKR